MLMIGAGNMGLTFAKGMVDSPYIKNKHLLIYDKSEDVRQQLKEDSRFCVYDDITQAVKHPHIIFLAVKPYHCEVLFEEIKPLLSIQQVLVYLMAGITLNYIVNATGLQKVVRVMPNLPAKVTAFTETSAVTKIEQIAVRNLLDSTGTSIHVENEDFTNKSTGISGSGPAYVFYFMQSTLDAALKMGFSQQDSKVLVSQTFEGAVELFKNSDLKPEGRIEKVASKGGTTQAAIDSMEDNNVNTLIKDAAYAAFHRATELEF